MERAHEAQDPFLDLLPEIQGRLRSAFRYLNAADRDEALAETTASCYLAYRSLCARSRPELAQPVTLVRYAARQFHAGRRVGSRFTSCDVMSPTTQRRRGIHVRRLIDITLEGERRTDVALIDRSRSVVDQVTFRYDFDTWFQTLSRRERQIIAALRGGERANVVARRHGLSSARISQLRRELHEDWADYYGGRKRGARREFHRDFELS